MKKIVILLTLLLVTGRIVPAGAAGSAGDIRFALDRPFDIVAVDNFEDTRLLCERLAGFMQKQGADFRRVDLTVSPVKIKGRAILVRHTEDPEGREHHFSITVSRKRIIFEYTTPQSVEKAYGLLFADFHKPAPGDKNRIGYFAHLAEDESYVSPTLRRFDLVADRNRSDGEIRSRIEGSIASGNDTIELKLLSERGFALGCRTFDLASPGARLTPPPHLTLETVRRIIREHPRTTFVAILALDPPGEGRFKERIGHNLLSVEGLRFSRSYARELADAGFASFIVEHDATPLQYDEYVTPVVRTVEERDIPVKVIRKKY